MTQRIPPDVQAQVARLFAEEAPAVFRSALRAARGNRVDAEDLVQEVFRKAAEKWDTIAARSPEGKRGWLCTTAINAAISDWRKTGRWRLPGEDMEDVASTSPSPEHVALTRMQAERCLKVISEMPEIRRRVAYLRFHEGWTNRMIAEHLGISPNTVGKHVFDARADLKRALPEMIFTGGPDGEADADGEEEL